MTTRTTQTVVSFSKSFMLPCFDAPQPAGNYRIDYDEEMIEGISQIAWRRVGAYIHLPAIGKKQTTTQMVPFDPLDLEAALKKDMRR
jgi:hypothetical protein